MTLRLLLGNKKNLTFIATNNEEYKDKFFEKRNGVLTNIPRFDKLFNLGDFNSRLGIKNEILTGVLVKHGIGKQNDNGLRIFPAMFHQRTHHYKHTASSAKSSKNVLMQPLSKHWQLIDYVLTRKKDQKDVRVTKAMCGAKCWTSHSC